MHISKPVLTLEILFLLINASMCKNVTTLEDVISIRLQETSSKEELHHLSRKRRYLQFPEGSSFQLVYDLVFGVVDYANYITVSITMALAYELPSKPPSELLDDVKEHLEDGTFDLRRKDSQNNIKYVDIKKEPHKSWNPQTLLSWNKFNEPQEANGVQYYSPNINPFLKYFKSLEQNKSIPQIRIYPKTNTEDYRSTNYRPNVSRNIPIEHQIYPILGKRIGYNDHNRQRRSRISKDILSKYDLIHILYHRTSRHRLYNTIEKYLDGKRMNGHQCILRALCETGLKMNEQKPGSFVGELMRALFTMPEPLEETLSQPDYLEESYDKAHLSKDNCSHKYSKCSQSLWSSDFVR